MVFGYNIYAGVLTGTAGRTCTVFLFPLDCERFFHPCVFKLFDKIQLINHHFYELCSKLSNAFLLES